MKITNLDKYVVTTFLMEVEFPNGESDFFTRHDDGQWTYDVSYDIHGETYSCDCELSIQLESIFQEHKDCI